MNPEDKQPKRRFESPGMKTLAVLGLLAILALGLVASVGLVRVMPNAFSTIGRGINAAAVSISSIFVPAEKITTSIDAATVNSGTAFTVSWDHKGKRTDGNYILSFECRDGVSMDVARANGSYITLPCNSASTTLETNLEKGSVRVIALSTKNRYIDVPVMISFLKKNGDAPVFDRVLVTIVNPAVADSKSATGSATSTKPTGTTGGTKPTTGGATTTTVRQIPTGSTGGTSNPYGQADLAVTFTDFGYIDEATQAFVSSSSPMNTKKLSVKFSISNIGNKATSDAWQFSAVLPTLPSYIFQSDSQRALQPGDRIEYTLSFDSAIKTATSVPITVNADANNRVNEGNKANNIVTKSFSVSKAQ